MRKRTICKRVWAGIACASMLMTSIPSGVQAETGENEEIIFEADEAIEAEPGAAESVNETVYEELSGDTEDFRGEDSVELIEFEEEYTDMDLLSAFEMEADASLSEEETELWEILPAEFLKTDELDEDLPKLLEAEAASADLTEVQTEAEAAEVPEVTDTEAAEEEEAALIDFAEELPGEESAEVPEVSEVTETEATQEAEDTVIELTEDLPVEEPVEESEVTDSEAVEVPEVTDSEAAESAEEIDDTADFFDDLTEEISADEIFAAEGTENAEKTFEELIENPIPMTAVETDYGTEYHYTGEYILNPGETMCLSLTAAQSVYYTIDISGSFDDADRPEYKIYRETGKQLRSTHLSTGSQYYCVLTSNAEETVIIESVTFVPDAADIRIRGPKLIGAGSSFTLQASCIAYEEDYDDYTELECRWTKTALTTGETETLSETSEELTDTIVSPGQMQYTVYVTAYDKYDGRYMKGVASTYVTGGRLAVTAVGDETRRVQVGSEASLEVHVEKAQNAEDVEYQISWYEHEDTRYDDWEWESMGPDEASIAIDTSEIALRHYKAEVTVDSEEIYQIYYDVLVNDANDTMASALSLTETVESIYKTVTKYTAPERKTVPDETVYYSFTADRSILYKLELNKSWSKFEVQMMDAAGTILLDNTTYSSKPVHLEKGKQYYVVVKNIAETYETVNFTVTPNSISPYILGTYRAALGSEISINVSLDNYTAYNGQLEDSSSGDALDLDTDVEYVWYKYEPGEDEGIRLSCRDSILTDRVTVLGNTYYEVYVKVFNKDHSAYFVGSADTTVSVKYLTVQPAKQSLGEVVTVMAGDSVDLEVAVNAAEGIKYQITWYELKDNSYDEEEQDDWGLLEGSSKQLTVSKAASGYWMYIAKVEASEVGAVAYYGFAVWYKAHHDTIETAIEMRNRNNLTFYEYPGLEPHETQLFRFTPVYNLDYRLEVTSFDPWDDRTAMSVLDSAGNTVVSMKPGEQIVYLSRDLLQTGNAYYFSITNTTDEFSEDYYPRVQAVLMSSFATEQGAETGGIRLTAKVDLPEAISADSLKYSWYRDNVDEGNLIGEAAVCSDSPGDGLYTYILKVTADAKDGTYSLSGSYEEEVRIGKAPEHTHSYDSGKVTTAATCKAAGVKTYTCSVCGETKTESIAKLTSHSYDGGKVTTAATCKAAGIKTYTCSVCGGTKTESIAKLTSHSYDGGKVTTAATCKAAGVKTYTCSVCGGTKTESIVKLTSHSYDGGKVTTAATCKAAGVKTYTCSVCGETKTESITKLTSHSYDGGKVTTAATCKAAGVKIYTCSVCGETKTESITKLTSHTYGSWKVTQQATGAKTGTKVRTCSVCGAKETEKIAKLTAYLTLNAKGTLPMKVKQTAKNKVLVTGVTKGLKVTWKSSNAKVVSVTGNNSGCTLKALKAGKAVITAKAGSVKKTFTVKVTKKAVAVKKITVAGKKVTLKKKGKYDLKTVLTPLTTTDKVKYTTSNKKVAKVSKSGVITGVKAGKATITVKAGKKSVKVKVTVK